MFPICSNLKLSRLDLRRLPETSRARRRERLPRAVSQTALGRPPGITTRMMSERPQWSAARRVPRSQGARGRLASVLRRVSHTRQSAAYRTAARAPFRRSAPSLEGDKERGAGPCASVAEAAKRAAKRWLFDKVEKGFPVARMERRRMREQPICGSQAVESPLPDFASLHPGYRQSVT